MGKKTKRRIAEAAIASLTLFLTSLCVMCAGQNAGAYWSGFDSPEDSKEEGISSGYVIVDALGTQRGAIGPFRSEPLSLSATRLEMIEEAPKDDTAPAGNRRVVWKKIEVSAGDTLSKLSEKYGIAIKEIMRANELIDQHKLMQGQTLYIPDSPEYVLDTMAYVRYLKSEEISRKKQAEPLKLTDYAVKEGDTLWSISNAFDIDINSLFGCNTFTDVNMLKVGALIRIPNQEGIMCLAKDGQTPEAIAEEFGVFAEAVFAANRLQPGEILAAGREVFLPGAKVSVEAPKKPEPRDNSKDIKDARRDKSQKPAKRDKKDKDSRDKDYKQASSGGGSFSWPIRGKISSPFGWRKDPVRRGKDYHTGLDIRAPRGTVITASMEGKVVHSGWMGGYGKTIVIQHPNGLTTLYAHCSKLIAGAGSKVKKGQKIALVGSTGRSTGNHVHFEVRKNGSPMNPRKYLR